jgi:branched-chain amino acid transport system ATP-binding protein
MLQVSNLAVDHGKLRAVWDVSFRVEKGERVGLLGANGAGKSTTLGAVLGIYPPASGTVRFENQTITGRSTAGNVAAGMAIVPEGRRLFPDMSVYENLKMGAYPSGARAGLKAQLERVYALFPVLAERRNQAAGTLSGGEQQMVAIGRALMSNPVLLLMDEPFLGMAPIVVEQVMTALEQIPASAVTIVLVEQNIHRALEFVQRAYVIENGRTVLEGGRQALIEDTAFSNKFLGLQ